MGVQTAFSYHVTQAIKAELARADKDGLDLVEPLRLSRNSVYARLRGDKPFTTEEIAHVAEFLQITPEDLIFSSAHAIKEPAA